jgi:hypothetical protein
MSVRRIKAGTTDVSIVIRIIDSTDGTPETGVVFNTSGIDLWYRREGAASVDITEATLSALTDAHTDGGFLHINDGWYRLDLPDAACASGVSGVQIGGTVTGMVVLAPYVELEVNNAADVYSRLGAPAGASISADIAAIEAQTDDIGAAGAGLTAIPWNAAWDAEVQSEVADALAVYDPPTNAELTAATANLDVAVSSRLASASYTAPLTAAGTRSALGLASANLDTQLSTIDTVVDSILVDTAEIGAAGAGLTALAAQSSVDTIDTNVDAIKAKTDSLTFTQAGHVDANIQRINDVIITGNGQVGTEFGV